MIMKFIRKTLDSILKDYIKGKIKDDIELTERLRKESKGSSVLFYFLIEHLFVLAYGKNILILSKGLLKYYLKSEVKDYHAFVLVGRVKNEYTISWADTDMFVYVLRELKMEKTIDAYGRYLSFKHPEEADPEFFRRSNVKKFKDIEAVVHVFLKEFDSIVPADKRYMRFKK